MQEVLINLDTDMDLEKSSLVTSAEERKRCTELLYLSGMINCSNTQKLSLHKSKMQK
jgi:hypothetical protein